MFEKAAASTKKFVSQHKTALAVAATATIAVVLHVKITDNWNDFLEEHNLTDVYYTPEDTY